jgi:hypothetical protein
VRKRILEAIADAIEEAQQDILRAQEEQKRAREKTVEDITTNIDLKIRAASAQENEAKEIALRRRKVEIISKELARLKNAHKKGTKEWLELRARLAEENAAIRDLLDDQKKDKDKGQSAQQFFFEQLQAQQGFASNLMGNLITGPTAGLVGVPAPSTGPGRGIQAAAAVADGKAGGGPSAGQANTTNALLERILNQLKTLNGGQVAPEAKRQYKVGQAMMDGAGIPHGI